MQIHAALLDVAAGNKTGDCEDFIRQQVMESQLVKVIKILEDEIVIRQRHPAKYSDVLLPIFVKELEGYEKILDPFAGTGKLRIIRPDAFLLEIEYEWAKINGATVGDALAMPWDNGTFDAVCTSPTYGNRMADHFTDHQKDKNYTRNTYRHALGRPLTKNNSGEMQWGDKYCEFHEKAWREVWRVLRPNGKFILNVSDHIRKGVVQEVTKWHKETAIGIGFVFIENIKVKTQRQRQGRNGEKRVNCENVMIFRKAGGTQKAPDLTPFLEVKNDSST